MNLYDVTKFSPYFPFTLYCFYTKISSFIPAISVPRGFGEKHVWVFCQTVLPMWTVEWKLDSLKPLEIEPGSSFPLKGKSNKINKNWKTFLLFLFHLLISTFHVPTKKQPLVLGFQGQKQVRRLRLLNKRRYSISAEIIPRHLHSKTLIRRQSYLCWSRCFQERTSGTCHELFPGPFGLL